MLNRRSTLREGFNGQALPNEQTRLDRFVHTNFSVRPATADMPERTNIAHM